MSAQHPTTHYSGPLTLADAKTKLRLSKPLSDDAFTRDGPRSFVEYRDLGLSEATGGRIGAKHIRARGGRSDCRWFVLTSGQPSKSVLVH